MGLDDMGFFDAIILDKVKDVESLIPSDLNFNLVKDALIWSIIIALVLVGIGIVSTLLESASRIAR